MLKKRKRQTASTLNKRQSAAESKKKGWQISRTDFERFCRITWIASESVEFTSDSVESASITSFNRKGNLFSNIVIIDLAVLISD